MSVKYPTVKKAGPYAVASLANGQILIVPTWPEFPRDEKDQSGGPGVASRVQLAQELGSILADYGKRHRP